MSNLQITIVIICLFFALLTIPVSILVGMSERGTFTFKRVGGLRFIKIGRINLSISIAKAPLSRSEKEMRKAWRAESRAELHANAKIGRAVRYAELKRFAAENRANTIRQLAAMGSDRSPDEIWH